ncbi:MAG: endonuclease/exonuclease/phosphatase family protein [Verrucomicrobiota bacterium]
MRLRRISRRITDQAPSILGAFSWALLLATTSCDRTGKTPDWDLPPVSSEAALAAVSPQRDVTHTVPTRSESPGNGLRFVTYNVENWLTMERLVNGKKVAGSPKPEEAKQAVIALLARHAPDVIGLCEVGTAADLAEIQERLKAVGLDLPNTHFTGGADPTRHLGLLSKFPITATARPTVSEYRLGGKTYGISRGILDASIAAHGKSYRFLGVHLKSKLETALGNQEEMRLHEAQLLRRHVDSILHPDPNARLVVYGDLNDTRASTTLRTIGGKLQTRSYLTAIPACDSHQETWTQRWELNDVYSRFDFILVSQELRSEVDFPAARILDDPEWSVGSDHRAVMAIFK